MVTIMTVLPELNEHAEAAFSAICDELAARYGFNDNPQKLTEALRDKIVAEAVELTERWDEAPLDNSDPQPRH